MSLMEELIERFGLGRIDLERIIWTAPARYKVFQIPKRKGGVRTIAQPSRELKAIQRFILQTKLASLPVHQAATGYVSGRGILANAQRHQHNRAVLKLDFRDFFPSIKTKDWERLASVSSVEAIDLNDLPLYSKIMFWGQKKKSVLPRCLSIGAPTSPALSNILMFALDTQLTSAAQQLGVTYTRYADDITVSGKNISVLVDFERKARTVVRACKSPRLAFNDSKRGIYVRGQRQMITGLIITPHEEISIGRSRKREISALLHRSLLNQLDEKGRSYLKGMLGFCIANEPTFVSRMRTKYGDLVIDAALTYAAPGHQQSN